jgi:hypothetical protein
MSRQNRTTIPFILLALFFLRRSLPHRLYSRAKDPLASS